MPTQSLSFRTKITLPTAGSTVPVGKILCIGRNYADHADEMAGDVPDEPMVFLKPASAVIRDGETVRIPSHSREVHHEVELVAVIGNGGRDIPVSSALDHVDGYAAGLDMTARDLQSEAKERGEPWTVAKGFDTFAPLGPITAAGDIEDPQNLTLQVAVNGETRQRASTRDMVFSVANLVHYCSQIFTLAPGDLVYTGTPAGVGPVRHGDTVVASVTGCGRLHVSVDDDSSNE